jgi:hypothetical protein
MNRLTLLYGMFFSMAYLMVGNAWGQADTEIGDFWFKLHVNKKLDEHWTLGTDLQLRRQDRFIQQDENIFRLPSVYSVRFWVYRKIGKRWTIIYSPGAFFQNYQLRPSGQLTEMHELRTMAGASHALELGRFTLRNRLLYEYRWIDFDQEVFRHQHRLRLQNALLYQLAKWEGKNRLDLLFFNEFFFATPDYRTFGFDQNRDFLGLKGQHSVLEWTLGYQYTRQRQGEANINRHSMLAGIQLNF